MLDAIYINSIDAENEGKKTTFSIFEFKQFSDQKIALHRHSLFCPVCLQPAYFRRASVDGKQACFGSRHHLPDCSELNSHLRNASDINEDSKETASNNTLKGHDTEYEAAFLIKEQQESENQNHQLIERSVKEEQGFVIDFSPKIIKRKKINSSHKVDTQASNNEQRLDAPQPIINETEKQQTNSIKQSLAKLLTSLLRGSSLATSDVWVHTSEKHKWRAKNLFVKLEEANVVETGAPRMYWGTISYADKELLWLNVQGNKQVSIPIKLFRTQFIEKYSVSAPQALSGASIILFAKCIESKDKSRQFLQLWSNDLQFLHLSLKD